MILLLLAATLHVPFPQALRVAVSGQQVFAASASGQGAVIRDGKIVQTFEAGDNPSSIAVMGGDVVIAHHERKYITIHRAPSFAPRQIPVDVTPHTHFAAAGDVDGDGKPDIAVNDMGGKRVVVLWGPDFTQTTAALTGSKGHAYENVAIVGRRLYVPCWPQSQVAVLHAHGREITQEKLIELPNPAFFVAGDVAVVTYSGSSSDTSRDGLVMLGSGKVLDAGRSPVRVVALNGVVATAALGGTVKYGDRTLDVPHAEDIALGDLDGDGKPDLAIAAGDEIILVTTR
ncbi:MAG: FG-GAP repeat protein [Myxococcales bacterium]